MLKSVSPNSPFPDMDNISQEPINIPTIESNKIETHTQEPIAVLNQELPSDLDYFDSIDKSTISNNLVEEVQKHLHMFGLNNFDLITALSTFQVDIPNKYILDYINNLQEVIVENNKLKFINQDNTLEYIQESGRVLEGTFNKALRYTSGSKHYLIKINKAIDISSENQTQIKYRRMLKLSDSFYENLKHIILYILIRLYIKDKIKLIPKIYTVGYNRITEELYSVLELGEKSFERYIIDNKNNIKLINIMLYSIYNALELITNIGPGINFRHGDLKFDNIVLTSDNKPMIIDFGLSEFDLSPQYKLFSIISGILNYTRAFPQLNKELTELLNMSQDIILLIQSFRYFITEEFITNIFNGINYNKNILLDGRNLNRLIKHIFRFNSNEEAVKRRIHLRLYHDSTINGNCSLNLLPLEKDLLNSKELAEYIGLTPENINQETIYSKYQLKYLKYKKKYLELKKNFS